MLLLIRRLSISCRQCKNLLRQLVPVHSCHNWSDIVFLGFCMTVYVSSLITVVDRLPTISFTVKKHHNLSGNQYWLRDNHNKTDCAVHSDGQQTSALSCATVFTARRVYIARTMLWQDVCPSVCHTPVLCLNGYTYRQSFSLSGSPTILVFPYQTGYRYSDGNPTNGGVECKGVW